MTGELKLMAKNEDEVSAKEEKKKKKLKCQRKMNLNDS